jgi:hypothetical protein
LRVAYLDLVVVASSLQNSLTWLNIYAELLGIQSYSLWRIRGIVAARSSWPYECEYDIDLLMSEMQRVRDRFRYWENVVDGYVK